jgi:hypothetical protein
VLGLPVLEEVAHAGETVTAARVLALEGLFAGVHASVALQGRQTVIMRMHEMHTLRFPRSAKRSPQPG